MNLSYPNNSTTGYLCWQAHYHNNCVQQTAQLFGQTADLQRFDTCIFDKYCYGDYEK